MNAVTDNPRGDRLLTIGAVCEALKAEFEDISISKIRYLEDQGLLTPTRTRGGYRLYAEADVERLRTILRLQRDEFLPLRVIREELERRRERGTRARRRRAAPGSTVEPRRELIRPRRAPARTARPSSTSSA